MANYKAHNIINIFIALPLLMLFIYWYFDPGTPLLLTFAGVYMYSTFFMSPDVDLAHNVKKRFTLRAIFYIPWYSYSRLFAHRKWSHSIFLGSPLRILWLSWFLGLIFIAAYWALPAKYVSHLPDQQTFITYLKQYKIYIFYGIAAVCCADWCHLIVDHETSSLH